MRRSAGAPAFFTGIRVISALLLLALNAAAVYAVDSDRFHPVAMPLVGGLLVDTVGWEWCFFAGLPVALLAFVVLQKTLHLPVVRRDVSIDDLGALLDRAGLARFHERAARF